ncbi:MAG TPA: ribonuclease R [Bacteroidaceae bacterium]|nr:ribonuclease R [Bacteroidaceae bacterium]
MSKSYKNNSRLSKKLLTESLVSFFKENQQNPVNIKRVFSLLKLNTKPARNLCLEIIQELVDDGVLVETQGLFKLAIKEHYLEGLFQRKNSGKNYFIPDDGGDPIFVAERNSGGAMNGDRVKLALFARRMRSSIEGEVVEIIKRAKDKFVGTLQVDKQFAFLLSENRNGSDIFIPRNFLKNGKTGDKAVVKIVKWPDSNNRNPVGKIIDILGQAGENNTEMHAILAEHGLPYSYPKNIEKAANKISASISAQTIAEREDFRKVTTITIDPKDAKDFDDAISIKPLQGGFWEVGIHIADVSYYVEEGGIIDKEALKRATSIYLVDRTIPMLPEKLSNELCSLRPNEDKLTYSVIFTISEAGQVKNSRISRTIINSDRRFTYQEVQNIIEREQNNGMQKLPGDELDKEIMALDNIAKKLREKRFASGAISFERVEVRFEIDENSKPVSVYFQESKDSNNLIEEFMLLANRTVAEKIGKRQNKQPKVFVYRIHDQPSPEKLANLSQFISKFGFKIKTSGKNIEVAKSLNKLLIDIKGRREQNLVETISLRSMQKAVYSTTNVGHYGLAFDYYTHFTSPIRRYPDLIVHRLLTRYLSGKRSVMRSKYENLCDHCSNMEQLAEAAERSSIKYKQVEYMSERMGIPYEAIISGVTEWGLYAEIIENKCEGLIPIRTLVGDFFEFDEKNYSLIGQKTHKRYRLGDTIKIEVTHCNLDKKQMDFALIEK